LKTARTLTTEEDAAPRAGDRPLHEKPRTAKDSSAEDAPSPPVSEIVANEKDVKDEKDDKQIPSLRHRHTDDGVQVGTSEDDIEWKSVTPRKASVEKAATVDSNPPAHELWTYEASDTDTLWDISKRFYGSGRYYPVLMEHNPGLELFQIGAGVRVQILKNRRLAREIHGRIVKREGKKLIWYYTVSEGDTLESIAGKYYKGTENAARVLELNPGTTLQTGERIRIQLD
jgi:nucleoid-associated protein YgaU